MRTDSFLANCPLVWTGIIFGYIFLLIIDAKPDWNVFAIPGLVVNPAILNSSSAVVPGVYETTGKKL